MAHEMPTGRDGAGHASGARHVAGVGRTLRSRVAGAGRSLTGRLRGIGTGLSTFEQLKGRASTAMVIPDDEERRELQRVVLAIADDIISYCDAHGIRYTLSGGSVIGALRHGGYIPWDDDMDLNMPRADYERFVDGFSRAYAGTYCVQGPRTTPEVGVHNARVRRTGTVERMYDDADSSELGVMVDIFVVESTYDNPALRKAHELACMGVGFLCSCRRFARDRDFYLGLAGDDAGFARTVRVKSTIGRLVSWRSLAGWMRTLERCYSLCRDENTRYVTIPTGRGHFSGEIYRREDLVPARTARFEGREFKVPAGAEAYLTQLYGADFMQVPPPEKREHHAYLALDLGDAPRARLAGDVVAGAGGATADTGAVRAGDDAWLAGDAAAEGGDES